MNQTKHLYIPPLVLQTVGVQLERAFLAGSVVDIIPVETAGQENGGFYDYSSTGSDTFNHTWGD